MSFDPSRFFPILPDQVERAAPHLLHLLQELESETVLAKAADVIAKAKSGDVQLWTYHDGTRFVGVVATRIFEDAVGKVFNAWLCYGQDCKELLSECEGVLARFAADMGCYDMEIVGRRGWLRVLDGYEEKAVVMHKLLVGTH